MTSPASPNDQQPQYSAPQHPAPQYSAPQHPAPQYPAAPQQGAQPPYAQAYPTQQTNYAPPNPGYGQPTNGLAIASMVLSIIGMSLLGIIMGHIALNQIKRTGDNGRGMAIAGLIIGYVAIGALLLVFLFLFLIPVIFYSSSTYY